MTTISARTILRSRNATAPDKVLSTLLLRYPRFIHSELMTHRALSRNAASSRAIPVEKIIDDILADTAMPIHWGAAQKGMQADNQIGVIEVKGAVMNWRMARDSAILTARHMLELGLHKQVVNRLLEPFMHITVLVSAIEWDNFLKLRDHRDAEPHIQILSREIRQCLDNDPIQELQPGQWHLPFVSKYDYEAANERHEDLDGVMGDKAVDSDLIKLSVARCASTSYKTTDGFDMTLERATAIYDKLHSKPFHASPFEHVAQADELITTITTCDPPYLAWLNSREHGNFIGFRQLRRQIELAE